MRLADTCWSEPQSRTFRLLTYTGQLSLQVMIFIFADKCNTLVHFGSLMTNKLGLQQVKEKINQLPNHYIMFKTFSLWHLRKQSLIDNNCILFFPLCEEKKDKCFHCVLLFSPPEARSWLQEFRSGDWDGFHLITPSSQRGFCNQSHFVNCSSPFFTRSYRTFQASFCLRLSQPFENPLWQFLPKRIPALM